MHFTKRIMNDTISGTKTSNARTRTNSTSANPDKATPNEPINLTILIHQHNGSVH